MPAFSFKTPTSSLAIPKAITSGFPVTNNSNLASASKEPLVLYLVDGTLFTPPFQPNIVIKPLQQTVTLSMGSPKLVATTFSDFAAQKPAFNSFAIPSTSSPPGKG
ncbi:uncharacterized protein LOC126655846 [Mercurialis annua]|uniref:uncharacterized protein LOC126655846 n=1 Tax=Mercurialis annua TaxID=3986 RepID=UPI0024ADAC65|nr:uncharacterized protein LOC126655846 [Mercurialis annua]